MTSICESELIDIGENQLQDAIDNVVKTRAAELEENKKSWIEFWNKHEYYLKEKIKNLHCPLGHKIKETIFVHAGGAISKEIIERNYMINISDEEFYKIALTPNYYKCLKCKAIPPEIGDRWYNLKELK